MFELIPNWHPVWVHFAVALLIVGALSYLLALANRRSDGKSQPLILARWCFWIGVPAAGLALLTGFWAAGSVAHDDPAHANMLVHRNWAIAAAVLVALAAVLEWIRRDKRAASLATASLALAGGISIAVTGFEGGQNVYEHGLGVQRLPDTGGHDHAAHDHDTAAADSSHDQAAHEHAEATPGAGASAQDHGDHDHDAPAATASDPGAGDRDAGHDHGTPTAQPQLPVEGGALADLADRLSEALAVGDRDAVFELLDPDVLIFESGNVEASRAEYEGHHMPADMAFLAAVERELLSRGVIAASDDAAVVSSRYRMSGTYRDRAVDTTTDETLVLEKRNGHWKIVHIHWSNG